LHGGGGSHRRGLTSRRFLSLLFIMTCGLFGRAQRGLAQVTNSSVANRNGAVASSQPAGEPTTPAPTEEAPPFRPIRSRAPGTSRVADRPRYARDLFPYLNTLGLDAPPETKYLDFGIQQRTRFEMRDDWFRENLQSSDQFLMRTRLFLGVKELLDPLRLAVEFQDSRRFGSNFSPNTSDINEADILQAFAELYFEDAFGENQPLSVRAGRMSFDVGDRRLVARSGFRNTTNAFDGFRLRAGTDTSKWEIDIFAMQPVDRRLTSSDRADEERWLYGVTGYWRGWSPHGILEPYYLVLNEDRKNPTREDREIHTVGLRAFGRITDTALDYDVNAAWQFGKSGSRRHNAFALHAELGYSFDHAWRPRVAAMFDYGTGDRDPDDGASDGFDDFFRSSTSAYGFQNLFDRRNTINPALVASIHPLTNLKLEGFYRAFWLASDDAPWPRIGRQDPFGESGDFVGHQIDVRTTYDVSSHLKVEVGYSYFMPGPFARNTGPADDGDFFYVMTIWNF